MITFRGDIMKQKLYNCLVNKHIGITTRYHKMHDGLTGIRKILSWIYLIWLNFAYYILFCRFLGKEKKVAMYESKLIPNKTSESSQAINLSVENYIEKLSKYEIISFDIFDTLIFRPVAIPTDAFYLVGKELQLQNFKDIRAWAEADARIKCNARNGHMEVTSYDIWDNMNEDIGCDKKHGLEVESYVEQELCHANPFMLEVWNRLFALGKKLIIVSDMYLPKDTIENILLKAGFVGYEKLYLSNEYAKNKAGGRIYREVIKDYFDVDTDSSVKSGKNISKMTNVNRNPNGFSIVHVGDNVHSDCNMARGYGLDVFPYQNINKNMLLYRPYDMSYMVGSAYRGIISSYLYNGLNKYSLDYEFGFIYGGLFALGYCNFIHEYCEKNNVDKILFLSRDGDILKQTYDYLYPDNKTEYVYWSRKAATKLEHSFDKHDYFRRFIYHKINQEYTIKDILHSMGLDCLVEDLCDWESIWLKWVKKSEVESKSLALKQLAEDTSKNIDKEKTRNKIEENFSEEKLASSRKKNFLDLRADDELTEKNGYLLRRFIEANWHKVIYTYSEQNSAAKTYYSEILSDCKKAVAVDIGWAGSGALTLDYLVKNVWKIPCDITGIIAGTNTIHNAEPDASEPFLQSGKLVAYLYSQSHNRDLLKKHDPNKDYNVYWELLLSSPTRQFEGFGFNEDGSVGLDFGKLDANQEGIKEIQKGIMDFVKEYHSHFKKFPYMFNISGRDAYAPMLLAASHNEKYLKAVKKRFDLKINVD